MGLLGTKAFLCYSFLAFRIWASFSLLDHPWVPKSRFRQLLIRKRRLQNSAALRRGPGFSSRDTHNSIFELFCRTNTCTQRKTLTTWRNLLHSRKREGHENQPRRQFWKRMKACVYLILICGPIFPFKIKRPPPTLSKEAQSLACCGFLCLAKQ